MQVGNRNVPLTGGFASLFSKGLLTLEPAKEGPAPAWTQWTKEKGVFEIFFRKDVLEEWSDEALDLLLRHEIGHVVLGHFNLTECKRPDMLIAADISVNYHLRGDNDLIREFDGVVAEDWLKKMGLEYQSHPVSVLHDILHEDLDQQIQAAIAQYEQDTKDGKNPCGGIEGGDEDAEAIAVAIAARGELSDEEKESIGAKPPGTGSSNGRLSSNLAPRPKWAEALNTFAQDLVQLTIAKERTHKRPSWIGKRFGLHVPTVQPTWAYKPDTVLLLVDTSGSMFDYIKQIGPTIAYLNTHNISVRIIAGDTRVLFDEIVTTPPTELPGGGGTDIVPLWDRANDYAPKGIVCFSDGYVQRWPQDPNIPVLWIMDEQVKAPFGKQVAAK